VLFLIVVIFKRKEKPLVYLITPYPSHRVMTHVSHVAIAVTQKSDSGN